MSSNADGPRPIPKSLPHTGNTEDTRLDFDINEDQVGYLQRMQELGFMDQFGRWTDKGIRECIK